MSKSIDNGGERGGRQDADEMRHGTLAEARDGARDTATAGRIPHGRAAEAGRRRPDTAAVPELLQLAGGLRAGAARDISQRTGVAEADVYGVGSFFHLLARPDVDVRVCTGLSCQLRGADALLAAAKERGWSVEGCSCLAACDRPTPILIGREMHYDFDAATLAAHVGPHTTLPLTAAELAAPSAAVPAAIERAACGVIAMAEDSVFELDREPSFAAAAFERAASIGSASLFDEIERSGLQGRGGAGFPAAIKWRSVSSQANPTRYVVLNADEGEPGTFKDREVLLRRPDRVVEGLAIAARAVGARSVYCYLRGEFGAPWRALEGAIERFQAAGAFAGIAFHLHAGHGAYICGEETALIEALEGKRGMPRLKPPFPTEVGLFGAPTLVHNVETIACVPPIVLRGADWFRAAGRSGAGTKLYSLSGHVRVPGVYELPLGASLDELAELAGGYLGELKAFSPGGASSGFLPASERGRALDFRGLSEIGSMLGSAGVVVLNESVNMARAALQQLLFFEEESCGQCAPCRIGTRFVREALERYLAGAPAADALAPLDDVAFQMQEGSICGLGQTAYLPLTSARRWFPEEFR